MFRKKIKKKNKNTTKRPIYLRLNILWRTERFQVVSKLP